MPAGRVPAAPPVVHLQLSTGEYLFAGSQLKLKVRGADTVAGTLIAVAAVGDVPALFLPRTTRGSLADLALSRGRIEGSEADDGGDGERDGVGHGGSADELRLWEQELPGNLVPEMAELDDAGGPQGTKLHPAVQDRTWRRFTPLTP